MSDDGSDGDGGAIDERTARLVARSLAADTVEPFEARVERQAVSLREAIASGELDNPGFAVGLELEVYAVEDPEEDGPPGRLATVPDAVFGRGAGKELGVHNAELNTEPTALDGDGLVAQAEAITEAFERARGAARSEGVELVADAMWTVPPDGGSGEYLGAVTESDGVTVPRNMRPDPRYLAIDNDAVAAAGGGVSLSVPGVDREFRTILFESLATSIQPHLQIPSAEAFPAHYNVAIRTLGPVLAVSTNSPFLPGDLYGEIADPEELIERTPHELRIAVFEQSVNHTPSPKVRVPRDISGTAEVVDRVVEDDHYAPFLREWLDDSERETFRDRHWEFDHKRGTYWRWLRCVLGGDPVEGAGDERSLRIEYRPIPTQPTVRDVVGMQALTAGAIRGLVAADHPLGDLPWEAAKRSFYSAAESGLEADLAWVDADGRRTDDPEVVFEELFAHARAGLAESDVPAGTVDRYLEPIEARIEAGVTPSAWKKDRVREGLADGASLPEAIARMQREYIELSRETDSFAAWL